MLRLLLRFFVFFSGRFRGLLSLWFCLFGVRILFCAFGFRGLFSLCICLFVVVFLFGGGFMIVYSEVDRLYGDCYDLREIVREIPVMLPTALVNFLLL